MNPILRLLIIGTRDPGSYLHKLMIDIIKVIWKFYIITVNNNLIVNIDTPEIWAYYPCSGIPFKWPEPKGINIDMMPFIIEDETSIPDELKSFWPIISQIPPRHSGYSGSIGYLTIHEILEEPGNSINRKSGFQIAAPELLLKVPGLVNTFDIGWGETYTTKGGMYLVSNTAHSFSVCPVLIPHPSEIVAVDGQLDFIRDLIPKPPFVFPANSVIWITDRTPFEYLPIVSEIPVYRQEIRVVSSEISVWFANNYTKNPLGIEPGNDVKIINQNKNDYFQMIRDGLVERQFPELVFGECFVDLL